MWASFFFLFEGPLSPYPCDHWIWRWVMRGTKVFPRRALELFPQAQKYLTRIQTIKPNSSGTHFTRGAIWNWTETSVWLQWVKGFFLFWNLKRNKENGIRFWRSRWLLVNACLKRAVGSVLTARLRITALKQNKTFTWSCFAMNHTCFYWRVIWVCVLLLTILLLQNRTFPNNIFSTRLVIINGCLSE